MRNGSLKQYKALGTAEYHLDLVQQAGTKISLIFLQNTLKIAYNCSVTTKGRCLLLFWWPCSFLS